ncbi:MAG: transglutaminase family protein [Verrucomicrobia bacterium]|jgi:hypothetical protein|nr:transglutaminase family protein [Verrucomicrobiota bacterium]
MDTLEHQRYLASSKYIDWNHPDIQVEARRLSESISDEVDLVKACFEFVRDEIRHSWDFQLNPVTCKASEVLLHRTGYCYSKSHLLAALLRANRIPAGLCYQRLTISNNQPPFCLHGLNAVYLNEHGWYRIDARGNKEGVEAECMPPLEKLAFTVTGEGELDLPGIMVEPMDVIVDLLEKSKSFQEVADHLPDMSEGFRESLM